MIARRFVLVVALLVAFWPGDGASADDIVLARFEQYLDALRQQARIPGLSAALVQEEKIVWEAGFGFEDLERSVRAAPNTPYPVGDLTQTLAAGLVLQCVEQGKLQLNAPIQQFTSSIPEVDAKIRHILSHTSEGIPGETFKYDSARYAALTPVIDSCSGLTYRKALVQALLDPLAMRDSVPGVDLKDPSAVPSDLFDSETMARYTGVLDRVAKPYKIDKNGRLVPSVDPGQGINAARGLVSTVRDLARYVAALDGAQVGDQYLLQSDTVALAWTNVASRTGTPLPSGLGWLVQTYNGEKVVWQFSLTPDAGSALIVKLPARQLTLILLANSDGLSAPFPLAKGDVTTSLFARIFLRLIAAP